MKKSPSRLATSHVQSVCRRPAIWKKVSKKIKRMYELSSLLLFLFYLTHTQEDSSFDQDYNKIYLKSSKNYNWRNWYENL